MAGVSDGPEVIGYRIAASMTGPFLGVFISEFIYGHFQNVFSGEGEVYEGTHRSLGIVVFAIPVVLFLLFVMLFILTSGSDG